VVGEDVLIRRARRGDLAEVAALVGEASGGEVQADEAEVMDWLFSKGMWVAVQDESVVGVATCQTENLVSVTDELYVWPARLQAEAGGALLEAIEAEVGTLMCEVNIVVLPASTSDAVREFLGEQGYEPEEFEALHRIYREVLGDLFGPEELEEPVLMIKRLRDRMVMVPI
jgi:N-acetylglutamate synthase-like GNAT family acetyltransferase